jgi:hypothetical protein
VAFKASEIAKEMLEKNKANAEKKEHHHILGPGGYKSAVPKWPKRAKNWWYGHGGLLDREQESVFIVNRLLLPNENLLRQWRMLKRD